jgi:hypothetical protein
VRCLEQALFKHSSSQPAKSVRMNTIWGHLFEHKSAPIIGFPFLKNSLKMPIFFVPNSKIIFLNLHREQNEKLCNCFKRIKILKINLCSLVFRINNFAKPRPNVTLLKQIWPILCVCLCVLQHTTSLSLSSLQRCFSL